MISLGYIVGESLRLKDIRKLAQKIPNERDMISSYDGDISRVPKWTPRSFSDKLGK